jgi:uncharacterized protein (TIGR03437 family)
LDAVEVSPAVLGVRRVGERYLEIYCTGLGATNPPAAAGAGFSPGDPYPLVVAPVSVWLGETPLRVLYAGLAPFLPGQYQITVELPDGVTSGDLRIQVGNEGRSTQFPNSREIGN